eukprot:13617117-Heterocapsa_arctica.AAC.1
MKGDVQYKNWTAPQKIDKLCGFMAGMSIAERKNLGSMGAMRMSRKQAIDFLQTSTTMQHIYTLMI